MKIDFYPIITRNELTTRKIEKVEEYSCEVIMSTHCSFTHLHVHTEFSLLDGAIKIRDLLSKAGRLGMDSVAITDHGNPFWVVKYTLLQKLDWSGRPLLGAVPRPTILSSWS